MGKRYKEKQLAAQAGRRRAVLQIDRVSRREVNEAPVRAISTKREVNPNSVTGIGLLGAYGEDSSDEEEEAELQCAADTAVDSSVPENNESQPGHEMDAKLADFFKEIESIDPDTAPSSTEGQIMPGAQAPPDDITSTTELGAGAMQSYAETNGGDAEEQAAEIPYPWQMCLDESTNCYYYWNTETNEVRWEPPLPPPDATAGEDGVMEHGARSKSGDNDIVGDNSKYYGPSLPDSHDADMEDYQHAIGPSLPPEVTETEEFPDSQAEEDNQIIAVSSGLPLVEYQDTEDNAYPATPPDSQCDIDIDGFEVVDTWGGDEHADEAIDGRALEESGTKEELEQAEDIPCKKPSLDAEQDSDDEFAAMLLEDTYHKGQKDNAKEETGPLSMEQETTVDVGGADAEDSQASPLLSPIVFEHLKASSTLDKTSTNGIKAEEKIDVSVADKEHEEEEEKFRQKILDLSATITNKLDFLEISRKGITNLQILHIEMETRIRDWRDGGLTSSHLVRKLEEAKLHFQQYEESAAPPGWTCKWHRTHKRYFYTNNADGESQWDYPLVSSADTKGETASAIPKTLPTSSIVGVTGATVTPVPPVTTPVATIAMTTAAAAVTTAVVRTVSLPAWGSTAQVYATIPSAAIPVHGAIQAPVMDYTMQPGLPMVSAVPTTAMYHNPPVPGTDSSVEAVPFSLRKVAEEPPPPPPGTDEPPPLPSGDVPPPPPPEPADEKPPPPPGEEPIAATFSTTRSASSSVVPTSSSIVSSSTISAPQTLFPVRSLIDYSDLDSAVVTSPPSTVTGLSGEMVSSIQSSGIEQAPSAGRVFQNWTHQPQVLSSLMVGDAEDMFLCRTVASGHGSGTSSPVPTSAPASTKTRTKRKKTSKIGSTLSSKARKVSSLVQKWQSIKVEEPEIESEEEEEIDPEVVSQKQIQQWKMEHLTSGQAAYNPNFEEIKGDWRERLLKKKHKAGAVD